MKQLCTVLLLILAISAGFNIYQAIERKKLSNKLNRWIHMYTKLLERRDI